MSKYLHTIYGYNKAYKSEENWDWRKPAKNYPVVVGECIGEVNGPRTNPDKNKQEH